MGLRRGANKDFLARRMHKSRIKANIDKQISFLVKCAFPLKRLASDIIPLLTWIYSNVFIGRQERIFYQESLQH